MYTNPGFGMMRPMWRLKLDNFRSSVEPGSRHFDKKKAFDEAIERRRGSFRTVGNVKVFSEWDTEDTAFSAYSLAPAPCFLAAPHRRRGDLRINVMCEKEMEEVLAEQVADDLAQRLRLGLPADPE